MPRSLLISGRRLVEFRGWALPTGTGPHGFLMEVPGIIPIEREGAVRGDIVVEQANGTGRFGQGRYLLQAVGGSGAQETVASP